MKPHNPKAGSRAHVFPRSAAGFPIIKGMYKLPILEPVKQGIAAGQNAPGQQRTR